MREPYAYFACLAGDTATAASVLARVGNELVFSVWGGEGPAAYNACLRRIEGGRPWPIPSLD